MNLSSDQHDEIVAARANHALTRRPFSAGAEAHMHAAIPVLDHGFVRMVDYMGNDEAIVQAARVSYGTGTKHGSSDEGLIRYLMRNHHSTPFEMCEIKLHVKLPIFVARQWIRHRTANVNEISARYSILDREFYIPEMDQIHSQSSTNSQGRGEISDFQTADWVRKTLIGDAHKAYDHYQDMISDEDGPSVAREIARMNLPTNIYTQWYWKTDLHNLFHFLRLRADPHAQFEIRCYAQAIADMVKDWVPLAYQAFKDYRQDAVTFSAQEMIILQDLLADDPNGWASVEYAEQAYNLSSREAREFIAKILPKEG